MESSFPQRDKRNRRNFGNYSIKTGNTLRLQVCKDPMLNLQLLPGILYVTSTAASNI